MTHTYLMFMTCILAILFFFFWPQGILVQSQLGPLELKHGVLTIGQPGIPCILDILTTSKIQSLVLKCSFTLCLFPHYRQYILWNFLRLGIFLCHLSFLFHILSHFFSNKKSVGSFGFSFSVAFVIFLLIFKRPLYSKEIIFYLLYRLWIFSQLVFLPFI